MLGQVQTALNQTAYTRPQPAALSQSSPPPQAGERFTAAEGGELPPADPVQLAPTPGQRSSLSWARGACLALAFVAVGCAGWGAAAQATDCPPPNPPAQVVVLNQNEFNQAQHDMDRLDLAGFLKGEAKGSEFLSSQGALNRMQLGDPVYYGAFKDGKYVQIRNVDHLHQLAEQAARETPR